MPFKTNAGALGAVGSDRWVLLLAVCHTITNGNGVNLADVCVHSLVMCICVYVMIAS